MTTHTQDRTPLYAVLATLAFAALHLAYEHLTGGVRSHHLLARPDLPEISNWFGLIVLPVLGTLVGARLRGRLGEVSLRQLGIGLGLALAYGALMALSFEFRVPLLTRGMFLGLFALALFLPLYRAELILGFVAGMTFTFGAVLPTLVASVVAAVSFVVRRAFGAIASAVRASRRPGGPA